MHARLSQYHHIWSQINSPLIDFEADVSIIGAIAKKMLTDGPNILTDHHNNRNSSCDSNFYVQKILSSLLSLFRQIVTIIEIIDVTAIFMFKNLIFSSFTTLTDHHINRNHSFCSPFYVRNPYILLRYLNRSSKQ